MSVTATSAAPASAVDLAELISAFHDVTARLQGTHEALRAEVSRLELELREAHEQLKRSRQLAALGEMAAGIAHEIRNPLGSIRLYAEMLIHDLAAQPGECEIARKISGAVRRLDAVVSDVLQFSREQRVRKERVDAGELVRDAAEACREVFESNGVLLHDAVVKSGSLRVWCDPVLMHQALVNVLRNAAEAIGDRGGDGAREVWIEVGERRVAFADGKREPTTSLRVRDTGPGVSAEVMGRMFNPFFTTRHSGTGLGLAIVHRILDAHGGAVVVENNTSCGLRGQPAVGATIELLLPVSGAQAVERGESLEAA